MRILDVDPTQPTDLGEIGGHLVPGETVHEAFRSSAMTILFTDRRIIAVQVQVLISERLETTSFPYRAIRQFSLTEGLAGEDRSEIRIWLGAEPHPIHIRAGADTDLSGLQALLAGKLE